MVVTCTNGIPRLRYSTVKVPEIVIIDVPYILWCGLFLVSPCHDLGFTLASATLCMVWFCCSSCNKTVAQIPQCTIPISHNTSFCNRMNTCVHISIMKWCIVGYLSNVLWDLWVGSITRPACTTNSPWASGVGRYHLGWIILIVILG